MGTNLAGRRHKFADTAQKHIPLHHCPFCGGIDVCATTSDNIQWYIYCERCEATGPIAENEKHTAEIWNHGTGEFKEVG